MGEREEGGGGRERAFLILYILREKRRTRERPRLDSGEKEEERRRKKGRLSLFHSIKRCFALLCFFSPPCQKGREEKKGRGLTSPASFRAAALLGEAMGRSVGRWAASPGCGTNIHIAWLAAAAVLPLPSVPPSESCPPKIRYATKKRSRKEKQLRRPFRKKQYPHHIAASCRGIILLL